MLDFKVGQFVTINSEILNIEGYLKWGKKYEVLLVDYSNLTIRIRIDQDYIVCQDMRYFKHYNHYEERT